MSYFFQLHLILHAYVRRFDMIDTVEKFLETKILSATLKLQAQRRKKKNLNLSTKTCIRSKTKQWSAQSHHQVGDGLRRAHRRSMCFVHRVTQSLTYTAQNSNLPPYKINSYNCVSYLNNRLFDRGEVLLIYWHHIHLGVEIHGNF